MHYPWYKCLGVSMTVEDQLIRLSFQVGIAHTGFLGSKYATSKVTGTKWRKIIRKNKRKY